MLTPQEAFKVGFLARCARDGLTPPQMLARVKLAGDLLEKHAVLGGLMGGAAGAAGGVANRVAGLGIPLALAAPPIVGGLGGYALARMTDVDDTDVDAIKNQELVDEYRRQAEALRRRRAVRDSKPEHRPAARPLL